jgi:hypothetical protein
LLFLFYCCDLDFSYWLSIVLHRWQ